jgi:delta1-piperideine-2-carboxylate reductase
VHVDLPWARERAEALLCRAGLTEPQAALVADALIEAELRGRPTHGLVRLPSILDRLKTMARRPVRIETDRGAAVLVDGGNELGYLVSDVCTRLVIERGRAHGLALVAAHDTTHAGMLGYFVEPIARAGLIGAACTNCAPMTAPAGAAQPVFGTNPLAVAIPRTAQGVVADSAAGAGANLAAGLARRDVAPRGTASFSEESVEKGDSPQEADPILLDFSTSAVTMGDLILAARRGEVLPEGVAVDGDGRPTTDPAAARAGALLTFGGHKGSGLALVIQVLCTAFTGATVFPPLGRDYGYLVCACDPCLFVTCEAFEASVSELVRGMKTARREAGAGEVLLPGERGFRARRDALAAGLDLDPALYDFLAGT